MPYLLPVRLLRRFLGDERGTSAVEFSLVAIPVFLLLMMIIECGIIFHISALATEAGNEAARLSKTGNLYGSTGTREELIRTRVRERLSPWILEESQLAFDMENYGSFDELGPTGIKTPGGGGDLILYTVTYKWNVFTPALALVVGSQLPITAHVLMKNEDF